MEGAAALVRSGAFVPQLAAATPARAIEELSHALRAVIGDLVDPALIAVLEREMVAPWGDREPPLAVEPGVGRTWLEAK